MADNLKPYGNGSYNQSEEFTEEENKSRKKANAFQFFLIPAAIVLTCFTIYALIIYMTKEPDSPSELLKRIRASGGHERTVYTMSLVNLIRRERGNFQKESSKELVDLIPQIQEIIKSLHEKLSEEDMNLKISLINVLGNIQSRSATDFLLDMLQSESNENLKSQCLQALGAIKDPDSVEVISKFTAVDQVYEVRKHAIFNLGAVGDKSTIKILQKYLTDDSEVIKWNSAFALGFFLEDKSGLEILRKMLNRNYVSAFSKPGKAVTPSDCEFATAQTIAMAVRALGKLKDKESLLAIKNLSINDSNYELKVICSQIAKELEKN